MARMKFWGQSYTSTGSFLFHDRLFSLQRKKFDLVFCVLHVDDHVYERDTAHDLWVHILFRQQTEIDDLMFLGFYPQHFFFTQHFTFWFPHIWHQRLQIIIIFFKRTKHPHRHLTVCFSIRPSRKLKENKNAPSSGGVRIHHSRLVSHQYKSSDF